MIEALRLFYIGLAGLEIGFLVTLIYYRIEQAKVADDPKGPWGLACLAASFIFFLLGTIVGAYQHFNDAITWPLVLFVFALTILLVGTYLINTSTMGLKHFFSRPRIRNKR